MKDSELSYTIVNSELWGIQENKCILGNLELEPRRNV